MGKINGVPWWKVWGAACFMAIFSAIVYEWVRPPGEWINSRAAAEAFLAFFFIPSIATWSALAPILVGRTHRFAVIAGLLSPVAALVPIVVLLALTSSLGIGKKGASIPPSLMMLAGFFAFLLVNWYIVFPIGAATGYLMDRIVNKEPTAT